MGNSNAKRTEARSPEDVLESVRGRSTVVSVYGPFNSRALLEVPAELAMEVFGGVLGQHGPTNVVEAVERDLEAVRERSPELADSTLAATSIQLARELEHPYNSATSKSMCAGRLIEALDRIRELAPEPPEEDDIDDLQARHAADLARSAAAAD